LLSGCVPWPQDLADRYRREGWWREETLAGLLRPWARADGSRVAVVAGGRSWTYAELDGWADALAAGLFGLGLRPLDRVVVQLPNRVELVALCVALFRLGALPVLALPGQRRVELTHLCRHTEAVACVVPDLHQGFDHRVLARDVQAAVPSLRHVLVAGEGGGFQQLDGLLAEPRELPPPDPAEVAFFLLSGGTTGAPKLIPRTHRDYDHQLRATAEAMRFGEGDAYLAALPVAHNAALGCPGVLGALRAGGTALLAATPSPDDVFPLAATSRPKLTTLMPSLLALWLDTARWYDVDLRGLVVQVGGAMLPPEVARRVGPELGCVLTHWFGMAEGLLCFTRLDEPEEVAATTQGHPLCPADEVRVVDDLDRDVELGQVGQLLARGPSVLRGYYREAQLNAVAFTADGYLRTGDLVRMTPERRLVAVGRIKDVINRGGEKVPVEEVEDHLRAHPAVAGVALVPMPDRLLGEKSCAWVVPRGAAPGLTDLRRFLLDRGLADYKLPDRVEVLPALPLTGVGKIDRLELRGRLARQAEAEVARA
jgi:2,3-dihydroxybenzoate-AMP ligase